MELKKIGALSLAKILGLFGLIYGLISGIALSIMYSKLDYFTAIGVELPTAITTLGYRSLIIMPLLNGIVYFIGGLLLALIYNLLSGWIGGVNLEFAEKPKKK